MESMRELIYQDLETLYPGKAFITGEEVCRFMGCGMSVVYNWNKRADPKRRPPVMKLHRQLRFPKRPFAQWLAQELSQ